MHTHTPLALTLEEGKAVFPRHGFLWSRAGAVWSRNLHGGVLLSSLGL